MMTFAGTELIQPFCIVRRTPEAGCSHFPRSGNHSPGYAVLIRITLLLHNVYRSVGASCWFRKAIKSTRYVIRPSIKVFLIDYFVSSRAACANLGRLQKKSVIRLYGFNYKKLSGKRE